MCGCTVDAECRVGLYCDSNVAVSGACYFGCRVTAGADHCATGSYCDARDGSIGNCVAEPCLANADCGAGLVCDTSTTPHVCSAAPLADSGVAGDASDASATDASDDAQADVDAAPDAAVDAGGRVDNGGGYGGSGCACTTAHTRASRETSALAAAFALFAVSLGRRRRRQNGVDCSATTSQKRRRAMT
jgi:MYXO-CTERM domain-containing protein